MPYWALDYLLGNQEILNLTILHPYVVKGLTLLYYAVTSAVGVPVCNLSHTQVLKLFLSLLYLHASQFLVLHLLGPTLADAAYKCLFVTCLLNCFWFQVRLGWHDAGTYDKNISEWPKCGGANGSLRFEIELKHAANAGSASPPLVLFCFIQLGLFF